MAFGALLIGYGLFHPAYTILCLVIGGLNEFVFGLNLFWWLRILNAGAMRLNEDGFAFAGCTWKWSDVTDFTSVDGGSAYGAVTYLQVLYHPHAEVDDAVRASAALGRLLLNGPPVYIPSTYDTGAELLETILRDRLAQSR